MADELRTSQGRSLTLQLLDQRQIVVLSPEASPPGSLIDVECDQGKFAIKVHACRKVAEEGRRFRVEGRPVNLGRVAREALVARL